MLFRIFQDFRNIYTSFKKFILLIYLCQIGFSETNQFTKMIVKKDEVQEQTKRLRFKPITNVQHSSGDINMDKSVKETKSKGKSYIYHVYWPWIQRNSSSDIIFVDGEKSVSLFSFLHVELTRGYLLEHDEERFSARREKVYSFIKIPQELEKFMAYGFFQCADSLLFVYTFLPLRFVMAFWSFLNRLFRKCFG